MNAPATTVEALHELRRLAWECPECDGTGRGGEFRYVNGERVRVARCEACHGLGTTWVQL